MSIEERVNEILGRFDSDETPVPAETHPLADNPQLYADITDDLRAGVAHNVIQKKRKVSRYIISEIAKRENLQRFNPQTKAASEAKSTYNRERRVQLLDQLFARLELLLEEVSDPREFQQLAAAMGTLIEKRRLEDGDVTNRTESVLAGAKERLEAKVALMSGRVASAGETPPEPEAPEAPELE